MTDVAPKEATMSDTLAIAQELVEKGRGYWTWENHLAREVLRLHSLLLRAEEARERYREALREIAFPELRGPNPDAGIVIARRALAPEEIKA